MGLSLSKPVMVMSILVLDIDKFKVGVVDATTKTFIPILEVLDTYVEELSTFIK